jgi:predicted MFS family arabinose efflux permease
MIPSPPISMPTATQGLRRITEGIRAARDDVVIRRCILTITLLSLVSLPFIGLMPTIAHDNLGIDPKSFQYGALYACFGIGTVAGAISTGTFLSRQDLRRLVQVGLAAMTLVLLTLALLNQAAPAYPVVVMLGFVYFGSVTSLVTVLQSEIEDQLRGRVMSLWQMGFGGFVPVGVLLGGIVADHWSIRVVLLYGAAGAACLCRYARLRR